MELEERQKKILKHLNRLLIKTENIQNSLNSNKITIESKMEKRNVERKTFLSEYLVSSIRKVKLHPKYKSVLYAISGSILYIYQIRFENETHQLIEEIQINKNGENLHGIEFTFDEKNDITRVLLYGKKNVYIREQKILLNQQISIVQVSERDLDLSFDDWIFAASLIPFKSLKIRGYEEEEEDDLLAVGYCHNFIEIWELKQKKRIFKTYCPTRCIVYTMNFHFDLKINQSKHPFVVASGTVFNNTILWNPFSTTEEESTIATLVGHKGVLFSISFSKDGSLLSSTSDDRSINLYQLKNVSQSKILNPSVVLFHHTARVWSSSFTDDSNHLLSCSEDSSCNKKKNFKIIIC